MIFIEIAFSKLEKLKIQHQRNILSFSPFWALLLQLPKNLNYPITSKRCLLLTKIRAELYHYNSALILLVKYLRKNISYCT